MKTDTIAAIATALSNSGIGIIRISGDEAVSIGDAVFRTKAGKRKLADVKSHTIHYGYIVDDKPDAEECKCKNEIIEKENASLENINDNEDWKKNIVDEVMVSVMRSPNTYTREDTVEINCHGGLLVMQKILETVIKHGARIAEPGEFTKRAFLNGRIDLSKAEAVIDIIHSQNEYALASSMSQLKGNLSREVRELREQIIYEIAFIESALDDPEHISLDGYPEKLSEKISKIINRVEKLISTADNGKLMKEGISTVIVGKPNAGKSSLLNVMVGEERAIVTDIAGTTRDVLQESIKLHGIGLNIIDTAGIHSTEDVVEKIGVEKAKKYAADADLVIYVVDSSIELDDSDKYIISLLKGKKVIILLNKADLNSIVTEEKLGNFIKEYISDKEVPVNKASNNKLFDDNNLYDNICSSQKMEDIVMIRTSTKDRTGIEIFENTIKEMFFEGQLQNNNEIIITNMRHKEALQDAYNSLKMVERSIEDCMPEDFYSIDLMSAYASLGTIIGEEVGEDLVNEIFSKFCMGK